MVNKKCQEKQPHSLYGQPNHLIENGRKSNPHSQLLCNCLKNSLKLKRFLHCAQKMTNFFAV